MYITHPFIELGHRLREYTSRRNERMQKTIAEAIAENPWFTRENIISSLNAITETMLNGDRITKWLSAYPYPENFTPRNAGVIMAGNIPLVGFFDMMCVLVSGNRAYIKPSSKDKVLTEYIVSQLKEISPELPVFNLEENSPIDAVIATGSDNTNRYFREKYKSIKHLLRQNRFSVAVLSGDETDEELGLLAEDIFSYFGMGCRNVSKIFVPKNFDTGKLEEHLQKAAITHPKYLSAYHYTKAVLSMRGDGFYDGGFFIMRKHHGLSEALTDIILTEYSSSGQVENWLVFNNDKIQCVVSRTAMYARSVGFGQSQKPELWDYPDGKDPIKFLFD